MSTAYEELTATLGADRVRAAGPGDTVDDVAPSWVARVSSTEQTASAMKVAAKHGLRVVPKGSGSKLDWGAAPEAVDLVLELGDASSVLEHAAGDLVLSVQAGTPLAEVHKALRAEGQQLAIDSPLPTATIGGTLATALSGPCRHYFGGVRDLLIGITCVLSDGTVAISGGKVVKNVAGYDLGRLYTGSFGTLGVITEAVFRLHPVADEHRWISVRTDSPGDVLAEVRASQAMPSAVEVNRPRPADPCTFVVQLEGRPEVTHARAVELADAIRAATGDRGDVLDTPPEWWGELPFDPATGTGLRVGVKPAAVPGILAKLAGSELDVTVRGAAGLGVLHVGLPGATDPAAVSELVASLRRTSEYVVVERAPSAVRAAVDPWGPIDPGVLTLMRRTKDQFDPEHRLAPGRFVGGI